ncbi:hypothetical protein ABPG74_009400 [Tetrahymena malaccensis]
MGNRQYDSNDLTKQKRDWVAFFIGLQQATEILMIFNIAYLIFFNGLILLPIIMGMLIVFKKWWMIMFDHRLIDQSSEQDFCLTLIGVTPAVITEHFVFFREIEFFIHHISCILQIYYVVMHNNDKLNFLFTILLGFFADISLFNQKKYFHYNRNLIILIQSTEIAIGCFLNITLMISCLKNYLVGIIYLLFIIIEGIYLQKYQSSDIMDDIITSQIGGYNQIKLRDKKVSKFFNNKDISIKRIFPFISVCQIVVMLVINFYFYDQEQLKSLRQTIFFLFLLYIPSIIQIIKNWIKFIKYGTHIKEILITPQDIQNKNLLEVVDNYTTFQKHQTNINYFIQDCQYDFIQQIFDKIFSENKRKFQIEVKNGQNINTFEIKQKQQIFQIQISFMEFQFFEIICKSMIETKFFLQINEIKFTNQGEYLLGIEFIQFYMNVFYQFSNCRITFYDKDKYYHVFQNEKIYQSILNQLIVFNKNIKLKLLNNPCHVLYDIYEL